MIIKNKNFYYVIILIFFLTLTVYSTFRRINYEKQYKKISYVIDYHTLIYNYTHFYSNLSFNDYLRKLQSNKILNCIIQPLKITDLLNLYNDITVVRGTELSLHKSFSFPVRDNYLYLFTPNELKITGLPYIKKIEQLHKIIYVFNINFLQLKSYYLNFSVKYEQSIKRYLKVFYLKNIPDFGRIDSYIMSDNNNVFICKKLDYRKKFSKLHYYKKLDKKTFISENFRAVLERNVKYIYIRDIKDKHNKIIDFIPLIEKLNKKFFKLNYIVDYGVFFPAEQKNFLFYLNKFGFYIIFIFIFSFILHKLFLHYSALQPNCIRYLLFLFNIILYSAFISVIIFNKLTYINAEFVPFIKLSLFVPYISLWFAVSKKTKLLFLETKINIKYLIIASLIGIFFILLIVRSGNYNLFVSNMEIKIRDFLENIFIVRPRFKEMFGYVFLYLLFFNRNSIVRKNYLIFYIIALIGITTTFNSFLHTHTPILITMLRTVYGIVIGSIIGYILNIFMKKIDA